MKIDPNRPAGDTDATSRLDKTGQAERAKTGTGPAMTSKDRVEVSADAKLLNDALKAAQDSSDIRPDVVERAKTLLESGELGRDSHALADRLIGGMLKKKP